MNRECVIDALLGIKSYFASRVIEAINDKNEVERIVFLASQGHIDNAIELLKQPQGQQKWVSIYDRLPESCGTYLVRVGKDGFNPQTKTAYWLAGKKVWKGAEAYSVITDVSHWMPLPEPPKEVSEDART